ncbi:hypothetical protein GCM10022254_04040 [Actinomadura meridiana]|uniref:Polyketide synthase n=1 Tax=Actinomadura meridiana TaxID=559626 RepID=A0ABP8BSC9_9ACTN
MTETDNGHRRHLADAARTIERLQRRLNDLRKEPPHEPVAIVGLGCRMPGGADSPERFWTMLTEGVDATREFPSERGDAASLYHPDPDEPGRAYTVRGGFLEEVDRFEPAAFGISPREALGMDPQQRLTLEVAWEALERAGYAPDGLVDKPVGVFIGLSTTDYVRMRQSEGDIRDVDAYQLVGEPSFAAGRLSYTLGLRGPSKVIDTTCSSSLVAVHDACQALRLGECDMALAGGVNMMLSPYGFVLMSKFSALSPDGRCKTFDASADGYARGEGAGILVLKRLSDAVRDRDHVVAVVHGSAVNHDGRSSGLTVPNPAAQRQVVESAIAQARIDPGEIDYVEVHGTGTSLGDPIELRALEAVIGRHRPGGSPLLVGSVKTNIGHLEPAAGVAGLLKLVLSLQHGFIPPHLHFTTPNPNVDWTGLHIQVTAEGTPWPEAERPRTGAVSSFGVSGTNAHCIVRTPEPNGSRPFRQEDSAPGVLLLSARTPEALTLLSERYAAHLREATDLDLADVCYTTQVGRARQPHGLAVAADSLTGLADALSAHTRGERHPGLRTEEMPGRKHRKPVWTFTGQGSTHADATAGLAAEPAFATAFDECTALFKPLIDDQRRDRCTLFAFQYAMAALWRSWGVTPGAVIGDGVGELVAACVAGALPLSDAIRLAADPDEPEFKAEKAETSIRLVSGTGFEAGIASLHADGFRTFLELSPAPGTQPIDGPDCAWIPAVQDSLDARVSVRLALGAAALRGITVNWEKAHGDTKPGRVPLPTTVWQGSRYWFTSKQPTQASSPEPASMSASAPVVNDSSQHLPGGLRRLRSAVPTYQADLTPPYWTERARDGRLTLGSLGEAIDTAARDALGGAWRTIRDLRLDQPVPVDGEGRTLQLTVASDGPGGCAVNVHSMSAAEEAAGAPWRPHAHAMLRRRPSEEPPGDAHHDTEGSVITAGAGWAALLDASVAALAKSGKACALAEATVDDPGRVRHVKAVADTGDVVFLAEDGSRVGGVRGLEITDAGANQPQGSVWRPPAELLYEVAWEQCPLPPAPDVHDEDVLLIADRGGVASALADELRRRGARCHVADPGGWDGPAAPGRIIVLTGLDAPDPETSDAAAITEYHRNGELTIVALIQRLMADPACADTKLSIVTRGAVPAENGLTSPFAGTIWGLARVIALEDPAHWGGAVDLDPAAPADADPGALVAALLDPAEDEQALRGGHRYAARLASRDIEPNVPRREPPISATGSYLITGAFGGIGRSVGRWLAERGAGRLVLLSRTPLPPRADWDAADLAADAADRVAWVRALEDLGARVEPVTADVADPASMEPVMTALRADPVACGGATPHTPRNGPWPLLGVVHAAGVSRPEFLKDVPVDDPSGYDAVWRPKVVGGWLLHTLTRGLDLDFFVGFSSIAATWGSQHLASYSAGNAFLDALADYRAGRGEAALTIAWGPWDLPSALFDDEVLRFLTSTGLRTLAAPQCLSLLGTLLAEGASHGVVCAVDWSTFKPVMEARIDRPLLRAVDAGDATDGPTAPLLGELAAADPGQRTGMLTEFLRDAAGGVLGIPPEDIGAADDVIAFGMDSLMVMDVVKRCKRELDVEIRPSRFFANTTLGEWVELLDTEVGGSTTEPTAATTAESATDTVTGDDVTTPAGLARRVALDPAIRPRGPLGDGHRDPRRVLLTGATGFVGGYLLDELLATTGATVVCLVRCADETEGLGKIRQNIEQYLPWRDDAVGRVTVLRGDLAEPLLGLSDERFDALAHEVDAIYHCGAHVNFSYTYEQLEAANVHGVAEILRLACQGPLTPVSHVSTYGIWGIPADGRTLITEHDDIGTAGRLVTGYVQTKWAAEQLVEEARGRGIPVDVYRPGRVLGDSRSGACLTTHFTTRVLKGCVQLGLAPDLDLEVEMTPVDYVSAALVRASRQQRADGRTYHLVNRTKMRFAEVIRTVIEHGWRLEVVPVDQWWKELEKTFAERDNVLHPVMDVVEEFVVGGEEAIDYDTAGAETALAGTGVRCPPLDGRLLETYFSWMAATGYLPAPTRSTR